MRQSSEPTFAGSGEASPPSPALSRLRLSHLFLGDGGLDLDKIYLRYADLTPTPHPAADTLAVPCSTCARPGAGGRRGSNPLARQHVTMLALAAARRQRVVVRLPARRTSRSRRCRRTTIDLRRTPRPIHAAEGLVCGIIFGHGPAVCVLCSVGWRRRARCGGAFETAQHNGGGPTKDRRKGPTTGGFGLSAS